MISVRYAEAQRTSARRRCIEKAGLSEMGSATN
jgi:hypothetical protein